MKRYWIPLLVALTLTMPWPTSTLASTATSDSLVAREATRMLLVSENKIRRATAVIDSLDLRLGLLTNRLVERDSTIAQQDRWWQGQYRQVHEWGSYWKDVATSWWHQFASAVWVAVGVGLAALALK